MSTRIRSDQNSKVSKVPKVPKDAKERLSDKFFVDSTVYGHQLTQIIMNSINTIVCSFLNVSLTKK